MSAGATSLNGVDVLRILCIHGYRQTAQTFREKTGAFRKIIRKKAELVFITAPNIVPPQTNTKSGNADNNDGKDERGWWFSREDDYFHAQEHTDCCKGYEESIKVVRQAFVKEGPFDGILGFSQGASMVSLLCGLQENNLDDICKFDFAIMVAGFRSRSQRHEKLYKIQISIPTLHVFGDADNVIQKAMSEDLLQYYQNPKIINHSGGHFIPTSGFYKNIYLDFLLEMLSLKNKGS